MKKLQDNIKFTDDNGDIVIFNHYSFCEWIKWIMVKYANKPYDEADTLVKGSQHIIAPSSYDDVTYITYELDYHWAMLLAHGEMYWVNGVPSNYNGFISEYLQWKKEISEKYNLKASYQYIEKGNE